MFFEIREADYLTDYRIMIKFEDGHSGIVDLSSFPDPGNVFRKFLDSNYFKNFKIEFGTLTWGNGELDIAPEHLYKLVTGISVFSVPEEKVG
jgi:hypothetical protein